MFNYQHFFLVLNSEHDKLYYSVINFSIFWKNNNYNYFFYKNRIKNDYWIGSTITIICHA